VPPVLVTADDVIPAAILAELKEIKELIMTGAAAEQAQIQTLADAVGVVGEHMTAAATQVQAYIAAHPDTPPADFTPLTSALVSLQHADTGLTAVLPSIPPDAPPPADPIPAPPADPNVPVDTGGTDQPPPDAPAPDVPPDSPPLV
jgi:hypothetical protein